MTIKFFLHTVKQLHIRINSGYESLHKPCMSSSQTKDSVEWEGSHRSPALAEKTFAVESCEETGLAFFRRASIRRLAVLQWKAKYSRLYGGSTSWTQQFKTIVH